MQSECLKKGKKFKILQSDFFVCVNIGTKVERAPPPEMIK